MQKRRLIRVDFGVHVRSHLIKGWRGGLAYCGDVSQGDSDRTFFVDVRRDALFERLKDILERWEEDGIVRWEDVSDVA